jgi:two-component system, NarL family, invasion response regulator UvrY
MLIKEVLGDQVLIKDAATFEQALELLKTDSFDLLLLDINIPGGDNLDMINAVRLRDNTVKILVFSSYDENIFAFRYIQAGAQGYISKESGEAELKKAILHVLDGNIYLSDAMKEQRLKQMFNKKVSVSKPLEDLSNRETEVMNLLIKGHSTTEIADVLHVRLNTISTYKARIFEKLEVSNIVELIAKVKLYSKS